MDNIFDVVNNKLFSPLSTRDKRANYELLMFLYSLFCQGEARPFIMRDEVVSALTSYIKIHQFDEILDEDDDDIAYKTAREKALAKIKQFKRAGYLIEDTTEGFDTNLSLDGNAIILLEKLQEIAKKGKGQMEYTGYVYAVYSMCMQFDFDNYSNSYSMLQQVEERTHALMNSLQGLNSKIRRYIENLMSSPDLTPKEIYQIVLVEYQHDVLFTLFNNIKSKDNPDRYSDAILDTMRRFVETGIPSIRANMMDTTGDNDYSPEHIQEIDGKILTSITYIIQSFTWMQRLLEYIDKNNNRYLNSAKGKLNFILNENLDVEGQIVQALRGIKDLKESFEFSSLIGIRRAENIDEMSAYTPRFKKNKIVSVIFEEPELTEDELALGKATIFSEDRFSREKVNEYVMSVLGDKHRIELKDMNIQSFDELLYAFLMQIYAEGVNPQYIIAPSDELVHVLGYRLHNFELIKQETK